MSKSYSLKYAHCLFFTIFLAFIIIPSYSNIIEPQDSITGRQTASTSEELIRGERLFYGLVYRENQPMNCVSCHNTTTASASDTINWNPDAVEISRKYLNKNVADLSKILLNPTGQKMAQVHKDFQLTPEEIMLIKGYMDKLPGIGLKQKKPVVTNLILFIIASFLFLVSTIDLIITKRIKPWINLAALSVTAVYITWSLVVYAIALGRSPDYSPDQPVKFSHQIHAGQNGTDCIYCHSYAPHSKSAGIPAQNVCMNCHLLVRNGTNSGMFEIAKVVNSYEEKKPIEWIKVYNLPDHTFFSHAQHVTAGGIDCKECHGEVEKMDRIRQVPDLSMGWCIDCHRTRKVNFMDNEFYSAYTELANMMQRGDIDSVTVEALGGIECMKCHY